MISMPIPNYPQYIITSNGDVIGKRGKPLVGHIDRCGYREVLITYNSKSKNMLVHRLVLSTFKPIDNMNEFDVNHKDGNKLNNKLENLEWCTRSENIKHAYEMGLEKKQLGENHHAHKLNDDAIVYIKKHHKKGSRKFGATALGRKFGVDKSTIRAVVMGETWKEVDIND